MITFQAKAKIAWLTMLTIALLATLNHIILIFVIPEEATLFIGWAAYTAYAAVALFIPSAMVNGGRGTALGFSSLDLPA
jgi:hypothetical protein